MIGSRGAAKIVSTTPLVPAAADVVLIAASHTSLSCVCGDRSEHEKHCGEGTDFLHGSASEMRH